MIRAVSELVAEARRDHALEVAGAVERAEIAEELASAAEVDASLLRQELREVKAQRDLLAERVAQLEAERDRVAGNNCSNAEAAARGLRGDPR